MEDEALRQVAQRLRNQGWKLAIAESLTAGYVQTLITSLSGASDYFVGGVTVYQVDRKVELLEVDATLAFACNGVSQEIAEQMARGAIRLFRADCAVATTGYAEPNAPWKVTTPFAYCSVAVPTADGLRYHTERIDAHGTRTAVQRFVASRAVELLLQSLS